MEFFNSIPFGIISMVIVGSSWCLIGLVMGDAPKRGIDPSLVQFFGSVVSITVSLLIMLTTGIPHCSGKIILLTCGAFAVGGFINFFMLQLMSYAMQRGPNGIIWAIIQSAMIFPFLGGIFFFDMKSNFWQWGGLTLVVIALLLFALTKNNTTKQGGWLVPAFICLAMCGVQQNLVNAPSYFESARAINSITRALASSLGALSGAIIYNIFQLSPERRELFKNNLKNWALWKYVGALQFFGLIFAYLFLYPGLNALADNGLGGISWPLMVGSCIASFSLCAILVLKEKAKPLQIAGVMICMLGLIGLCCK